MSIHYQPLQINLDMGTKYLINENAYFLGSVFAANESVIRGDTRYFIAPVRHNKLYIKASELELHFEHIQAIAKKLSHETLMAKTIQINGLDSGKFRGRVGFGTFFKALDDKELVERVSALKAALIASSGEVRRCFVMGMFDGRGVVAFDHKKNKVLSIILHCNEPNLAEFLAEVLTLCNVEHQLRSDQTAGVQLRITDIERYMEKIGWISERKFQKILSAFPASDFHLKEDDEILNGLKALEKVEHLEPLPGKEDRY